MKISFSSSALLALSLFACGQPTGEQQASSLNAGQILQASLEFHDPESRWGRQAIRLTLAEPRIDFPERQSEILIDLPNDRFELLRYYEDTAVLRGLQADSCYNLVDGKTVAPGDSTVINQYRLGCDRTREYRSFYQLLTGLPMTLYQPEIALEDPPQQVVFGAYNCYEVRARLNNPVIGEEWAFYFDQSDYQLRGYGYASAGVGEYIQLDSLLPVAGMRLPLIRNWYSKADSTRLGKDVILNATIVQGPN